MRALLTRSLWLLVLLVSIPAAAQDRSDSDGDDIDAETLLQKAAPLIDDLYLHPDAIQPAAMLRDGLQALEHLSPRILVRETGEHELTLTVDGRVRTLTVDDAPDLPAVFERFEAAAQWAAPLLDDRDLDADALRASSLAAALRTIDRHSRVIAGDRLDDFNTRFKGTLVGIGARIGRRDGALRVVKPFIEAPAGQAGLQTWDAITHIDGVSTEALGVDDAVERIRGPEGVPVVLTVQRDGDPGPRVFVIVREAVLVPSVDSIQLSDGVGYVNIDHFSKKTSDEFVDHVEKLSAAGALRGLIIDLRENQGGSMIHAARIVNHFVSDGLLIQTEGRDGGQVRGLTWKVPAKANRKRFDGPVVVLVNSQTASGSEIVAGGLKFLERALTVGSQTFGKGTVQKVYSLTDEVSMKLTVARYLLPGERFINAVGVTPEVMTGQLWLDPGDPTMPDELREPAEATGLDEGPGELDQWHNPGGGRPPTSGGTNAAPSLRLLYPRILASWGAPEEPPTEATPEPLPEDAEPAGGPPREPSGDEAARSNLPGDAGDPVFNDMELRIAHEILTLAKPTDRRLDLIAIARPIVQRWQLLQSGRLSESLSQEGIPWTAAEQPRWMDRAPATLEAHQATMAGAPPPLNARLELPAQFIAGEKGEVGLVIENTSEQRYERLRARLESTDAALDGASFLIGDLAPGETRRVRVSVSHSTRAETRRDHWRLYLLDDSGPLGGPWRGSADTLGGAPPDLEVRVSSAVEAEAGGGALITATVQVRDRSGGPLGALQVRFGEPEDGGVERIERFRGIEPTAANGVGQVSLQLRVRDPSALAEVPIRLRASDLRSGQSTTVSLRLPTGTPLEWGDWYRAAEVSFDSLPGGAVAAASEGTATSQVAGTVRSAAPLRSVEVIVGTDKVFTWLGEEDGQRAVRFDTPARLRAGPNLILVRTETADGVSRTARRWIAGP